MAPSTSAGHRDSESGSKRDATAQETPHPYEADNPAMTDGCKVVEVGNEDVEADDDTSNRHVPAARPILPRLNSQSRAPLSSLGSETDPEPEAPAQQASSPAAGIPFHVKDSREIPIPRPKSAVSSQQEQTGSSRDSSSEGGSKTDNNAQHDTPKPRRSPSLKPKEDSDGQNPTIQIPKVTPTSSGLTLPPNLAELAQGLEDKYVDEFGNILDWEGQVLGRVEGDLPSMIGRPVSATGEVLSEDGDVVGYVAENDTLPPEPPEPQPIQGMGEGLKVDHLGNILNSDNNVVGHFNGDHASKAAEKQRQQDGGPGQGETNRTAAAGGGDASSGSNCHPKSAKPSAAPSPSEIYLDVKSTNDGVQLIIKIPTVFNGGGSPNIHIGTG